MMERGVVVVSLENRYRECVGEVITVRIVKDVAESIGIGKALLPKGSSAWGYIPY